MASHAVRRACLLALAIVLSTTALPGCSRGTGTTVDVDAGSEEDTSTLTPLERGEARRAALDVTRAWIEAWMESDADAMRSVAATTVVEPFEEAWEGYADKGQHIQHVREQTYLDVIDMTRDGSQALVTYRYNDDSYVANASGTKVKSLPAFTEKEIQLTLDYVDGEWLIIRIIAAEDAYR